ncbi:signal recognition particle 19 kDa protein [Aciduliprofundum sp. MAR08-339]|uniref:signal recognition particle subunit SRP19/SEC65 family protein n=1 Tax=Aciduliprofundum sp. (strain MAR08-339) TaxID=673860 RepID=UPI0002A4A750|nr:signal recognition particle 19 kDa protein [Aciduliprofundum sp. MAR08-339]
MKIIIYPAYFNLHYSRREGRRVPKNLAFEPKLETIARAARDLGYSVEIEQDKRYPRFWWSDKGRIIVESDEPKNEVIRKIARKIRNL